VQVVCCVCVCASREATPVPQTQLNDTRCGKPRAQPQLIGARCRARSPPPPPLPPPPHQCDCCHVIAAALLPFFIQVSLRRSIPSSHHNGSTVPEYGPGATPTAHVPSPLSAPGFSKRAPRHPVARITGNPHLIFACRYAQQPTSGPAIQAGEFRFRMGIIYLFLISSVPAPPPPQRARGL
jgi:hypothetical protein